MRSFIAGVLPALALLPVLAHAQAVPSVMSQPVAKTATLPQMSDGNAAVISLIATGSGLLGPQTANHGLTLNCQKGADWWNNTSTGEVDCANIVVRQSGPGDSSAIQVNTENLGGGFLAVNESAASSVDRSRNVITHTIDIQEGVVNVGRDVYGFVATNTVGTGTTAFLGQSRNGTAFGSLLAGNRDGATFYNIDWSGNSWQAGAIRPGTVTVASLPRPCTAGQMLYAIDGRKTGEAAGAGSGVPVICTATRKGGATAWFSLWGGAVAAR